MTTEADRDTLRAISDAALMKELKELKAHRYNTEVAAWIDERMTKTVREIVLGWKDFESLTDKLCTSCVDACDESPVIDDYGQYRRDDDSSRMYDESSVPLPYVATMNTFEDDDSVITEPPHKGEIAQQLDRRNHPHPYSDSMSYLCHSCADDHSTCSGTQCDHDSTYSK